MTSSLQGHGLDGIDPEGLSRLEPLLSKHWSLPADHPLAALNGRPLGPYRLIVLLGPKNNVGARYFQLFLANAHGRLSRQPLALGLHNSGPFPAYNWVELIRYEAALTFAARTLDLAQEGLDLPLFQMLSDLLPPGGHIMVEYDSPGQTASERMLALGYPPVASPLGYLMFRAGCRSFRDWYISEGGREGPRKLQGFKPLNEEIAREKTERLRRELSEFLSRPDSGQHGQWGRIARRLGRDALEALERPAAPGVA